MKSWLRKKLKPIVSVVDTAKATGRGIKEIARIAYNLALGEAKSKEDDSDSKDKERDKNKD